MANCATLDRAYTKYWRGASIRQKYILGKKVGAIKKGLSYEEFEKIMLEPRKKSIMRPRKN